MKDFRSGYSSICLSQGNHRGYANPVANRPISCSSYSSSLSKDTVETKGSLLEKYRSSFAQDTAEIGCQGIRINLSSILCMKEYTNSSIEELRLIDYRVNKNQINMTGIRESSTSSSANHRNYYQNPVPSYEHSNQNRCTQGSSAPQRFSSGMQRPSSVLPNSFNVFGSSCSNTSNYPLANNRSSSDLLPKSSMSSLKSDNKSSYNQYCGSRYNNDPNQFINSSAGNEQSSDLKMQDEGNSVPKQNPFSNQQVPNPNLSSAQQFPNSYGLSNERSSKLCSNTDKRYPSLNSLSNRQVTGSNSFHNQQSASSDSFLNRELSNPNPSLSQQLPSSNPFSSQQLPNPNPSFSQQFPKSNPFSSQQLPNTNPSFSQQLPNANPSLSQQFPNANPFSSQQLPNTNPSFSQQPPNANPSLSQQFPNANSSLSQHFPNANPSTLSQQLPNANPFSSQQLSDPNPSFSQQFPNPDSSSNQHFYYSNTSSRQEIPSSNSIPNQQFLSYNPSAGQDFPVPNIFSDQQLPNPNAYLSQQLPNPNAYLSQQFLDPNAYSNQQFPNSNIYLDQQFPNSNNCSSPQYTNYNTYFTEQYPFFNSMENQMIPSQNVELQFQGLTICNESNPMQTTGQFPYQNYNYHDSSGYLFDKDLYSGDTMIHRHNLNDGFASIHDRVVYGRFGVREIFPGETLESLLEKPRPVIPEIDDIIIGYQKDEEKKIDGEKTHLERAASKKEEEGSFVFKGFKPKEEIRRICREKHAEAPFVFSGFRTKGKFEQVNWKKKIEEHIDREFKKERDIENES